ncbi:uncharacterized protein GGS22DRAFT_58631 [Annulohypoxylon maeteangense]|uniref:uncharacterized protein n=1 Tax=Annulohypoxylon maeteangense TaxID=1927788 RepID=UPI002008D7CC|nr:uncharacterized protein GGS22DRAFT_58631 [Annulohypoxylon maeteangense]KAI0881489.1 hypothetical protein GGS22DRAFT_58631 [Annulohypoxylon maeteangense]
MATWYVGGTEMSRSSSDSSLPSDGPSRQRRRYIDNKKRRPSHSGLSTLQDDFKMFQPFKRNRFVNNHDTFESVDFDQNLARPAFFIIKEANHGRGYHGFDPVMVEKTFTAPHYPGTQPGVPCQHFRVHQPSDSPDMNHQTHAKDKDHDDAAELVAADLADSRRRSRHSQHERILRSLISPKSPDAEFDIDDVALQGIFYAANEIFFHGKLKGRVAWSWVDLPSCLIGTTALRQSPLNPGLETLIFLSRRILKDRKYNRRLLISTFIHELIHSYLFVVCGFQSRECGGHTNGFQRIAGLIDKWAGPDLLYLCNMEAELSDFETKATVLPRDPVFDGWDVPWSHDPAAGDYILLNRPQCRLRPAIR